MGEGVRHAGERSDQVRIEAILDWYFNFADADLGIGFGSNYSAMIARMVNPRERTVASSDATEDAMFRAVEAIRRFRGVSAVINRLSKRDQRDLHASFTRRHGPAELASRPFSQRWFAVSSPAVRSYLQAHRYKQWSFEAGERLLVVAQRAVNETGARELERTRIEAWTFAERALEALLGRYAAAERSVAAEEAAEHAKRLRRTGLKWPKPDDSNPRRWS